MNPDDMIIRTKRTRVGWLIDALLTALAWIGFGYLCVTGLLAVLRHANAGPDVPFWSALLPTAGTLSIYVVVGLFNGVVLLTWALYNQYRFSGLDRRKPIPALRDDELARSFKVSGEQLRALQKAKVAVVDHEGDGTIADVHLPQPVQVPARETSAVN
ncbi:poly-beta-1,6-N-acetyl-D-glucosamine biosynthesis protein PgaD [Cupriavidus gilardii]|uniref:poly-beta-1,6-N-acetyl-D-glucosamine biosynthesis protein PgaD n=1 Tax=Cupriavidus gilardii TaxID=82541 RepID=UPI001ABE5D17|nr:poly-beta-1,6-N-acetyl-D-glucosamine biosynthesis protein PgaD [Cupriavidus gilardii]MBO4121747.1 poly-beta-1,6-N-acetyl-D-glucosamine biosynthesis protein PgaD [Cupriavidus gilardii]